MLIPVPSPNQKTLSDYVAGVLDLDTIESSSNDCKGQIQEEEEESHSSERRRSNKQRRPLSPTLLRKRIEQLKESETSHSTR